MFGITKNPIVRRLLVSGNQLIRKHKVVMFHTGRCGSTVLSNILKQHPQMHWGGEIFNPYFKDRKKPSNFLEHVIEESAQKRITRQFGFDIKYLPIQHLNEVCIGMGIAEFVGELKALGFDKFIVLHRKNYLRRAISAHVAGHQKQWHSVQETTSAKKVNLNPDSFHIGMTALPLLDVFRIMDNSYAELQDVMKSEQHLSLVYEDDILQDPLAAYEKVRTYLELSPFNAKVKLKRTNPFGYEELLSNFDQIKATINKTEYEWMLNA